MEKNYEPLSVQEVALVLARVPQYLHSKVSRALTASAAALATLRDFDGKVICIGLQPTPTGGTMRACHHHDPRGEIRGWVNECRAADKKVAALETELAKSGWRPIAEAPKDATPVDLWVPSLKRLVNMRRVQLKKDNVFYEPIEAGYSCVRDATHFMIVPQPPEMA